MAATRAVEVEISGRTTIIVSAASKAAAVKFVKRSIDEGALGWDGLDVQVRAK